MWPFCRVHFECCCFLQCVQHIVPNVSRPFIWIQESHMTRYIVNPINLWPLVTLNFFGKIYFEYIQHFTHWAHCDRISPNIQNVSDCLPIGYICWRCDTMSHDFLLCDIIILFDISLTLEGHMTCLHKHQNSLFGDPLWLCHHLFLAHHVTHHVTFPTLSLVYIPAGVGFCSSSFSPISCSDFNNIGVRWLGTFKMYSVCAHWAYLGHIVEYIQNVLSIWSLGTLESHVDCDLNVFTMYPVGIWALVPSIRDIGEDSRSPRPFGVSYLELKSCREHLGKEWPWQSRRDQTG